MSYDFKCQVRDRCWYCKYCCDKCMKAAGVDLVALNPDMNIRMRFCSRQCSVLSPALYVTPYIDFWDKTQNPPTPISRTCSLQDNHKELLYIYSECTMSVGYHLFDVTLCTGNSPKPFEENKVYAVCYCRQRSQQMYLEFFVSEDLQLQEMIVLGENKVLPDQFTTSANSILQMIIKQALATKGIQNVQTLMQVYGEK